jgi:hypothetical protein
LATTACSFSKPARPAAVAPAKGGKLAFVDRTFVRADPDCRGTHACASMRLSWPQPTGGSAAARAAVATAIDDFVLARLPGEGTASSPEEAAEHFLAAYRSFRGENPDSPQVWTVSRSAKVIYSSAEIVSLAFDAAEFTGGREPASKRLLATFDAASGRRYALEDLVPPDGLERLRLFVERRFREARSLAPGTDLAAKGFRFAGGRFELTDNFAVIGGGLLFHWNPGEVAPVAKGPTEVTLTKSEVASVTASGR